MQVPANKDLYQLLILIIGSLERIPNTFWSHEQFLAYVTALFEFVCQLPDLKQRCLAVISLTHVYYNANENSKVKECLELAKKWAKGYEEDAYARVKVVGAYWTYFRKQIVRINV